MQSINPGIRRSLWLLLFVILLGTFFRFFRLDGQSIWYDEAVSLAIADRLSLWEVLANKGQSSHPPLFYLLLRYWTHWVGISEFTARVPSVSMGVLTIPVIYNLGRRLFSVRVGLWCAFFWAVFPFQVYYAQEIRMYTLLGFLTALSLLFFLRAVERNLRQDWLAYGVTLILGFYTHYFIVFVVGIYHLYLLLNWQQYRHFWKPVVVIDGVVFLTVIPLLGIFLDQSQEVMTSYWLGRPHLLAFFTAIYFFVVSYTVPPQLTFLGLFVFLGGLVVGMYELFRYPNDVQVSREKLLLLTLGAFGPIIIVLTISQFKPIFLERTLIICTPFLILLLSRILSRTTWRSPVPYFACILGVLIIVSLYRYYFDPLTYKPPLQQAVQLVSTASDEQDLVLHTSIGSFLPFLFYHPPADHYLLWGDPDSRKTLSTIESFGGHIIFRDTLQNVNQLWLIVLLDHSIDYQREQVNWFDERFDLTNQFNIDGIIIRQYQASKPR